MLSLLAVLVALCGPCEPVMYSTTVAGDSVVLDVAIDNTQLPANTDSLQVLTGIGVFGGNLTKTVVKAAGATTTVRFAWHRTSNWSVGQTRGQKIEIRGGHITDIPDACGANQSACWGVWTDGPVWSWTFDASPPAAIPAAAVVWDSHLN
jgi:hypothetical protein